MLGTIMALIAAAMILAFGLSMLVVILDYRDVPDDLDLDEPLVWPEDARERAA